MIGCRHVEAKNTHLFLYFRAIIKVVMTEFPNIILYAIPFFILAMLVELAVTIKENINTYETKDAFASISMGLGNVLLGFLSKAIVLASFFYIYEHFRFFTIPIVWWSFVLILFADDLSIIGSIVSRTNAVYFGRLM